MHLINIKRLAYERRPVGRPAGDEAGEVVSHVPPLRACEPDRAEISRIVARFLERQPQGSAPSEAPQVASPRQPAPEPSPGDGRPAAAAPSGGVAHPRPVDFVSEDDVRRAIKKGEKIHIGPRTIITPSARDLGGPREVFVMTNSTGAER